MDFPEYRVAPTGRTMSACQTLCWIGYHRAFSSEQYFRPARMPRHPGDTPLSAALHEALPDPKPAKCPMGQAEQELTNALRNGLLRAYGNTRAGYEGLIPVSAYDFALVINARGGLEPDHNASALDLDLACRQTYYTDVSFLTHEVLRIWPAQQIPTVNSIENDQIVSETPKHLPSTRFSKSKLKEWYRIRVLEWPKGSIFPNEADDVTAARLEFPGIARTPVREVRRGLAPANWRIRGRRRTPK